jgi:hypothetical protein
LSAVSHVSSSDRTLKTDIQKVESALEKLLQLNGYYYKFIESGEESMGVMADEVEKIFPCLVITHPDTGKKSVNYSGLWGPMLEAIKELADKK